MKPLDWVLLIIAVPAFFLSVFGHISASANPLVKSGVATPVIKGKHIGMWLAVICFVLYRVWG